MTIRKGDKFLCIEDVNNVFGMSLFKKGEVYEVLWVDNEQVKTYITLNHILYANEYMEHELEWILKRFKKI
jgi:hypothetical protein